MAVHLIAVAALVPLGMVPLTANAAGFLLAFQVSYIGHSGWTFRDRPKPRSYLRMFLVSAAGFGANEICYAGLLKLELLDYRTALAVILAGVSMSTYLLSKLWVFQHPNSGT